MDIRTKKITLECFGENYTGFILVKRMKHEDVQKHMDALGLLDKENKDMSPKEAMEFVSMAFAAAKDYLIEAEVTRVSDGQVLSLDDLDYETELTAYRAEIGSSFVRGWAMGNGKGQQQG